jgi:hypothetical protein
MPLVGASKHNWTSVRRHWNSPPGCKYLDIIATATKPWQNLVTEDYCCSIQKQDQNTLLMCQWHSQIALPNAYETN